MEFYQIFGVQRSKSVFVYSDKSVVFLFSFRCRSKAPFWSVSHRKVLIFKDSGAFWSKITKRFLSILPFYLSRSTTYRPLFFSHTKCRQAEPHIKIFRKTTKNPLSDKIFSNFSLYFVFRVFSNRNSGVIMFWVFKHYLKFSIYNQTTKEG